MNDVPEAENVAWHDEEYAILRTDGYFTGPGVHQIYKRVPDTDNWERQPKGGITFYKSFEAAKEALSNEYGHKLAENTDAKE